MKTQKIQSQTKRRRTKTSTRKSRTLRSAFFPSRSLATTKEAELAYSQAQALIGESFQDIARRTNSLAEFRKQVLVEAGVEKSRVNSMSAIEASVRLEVLADQAKSEINAARRNAANYSETGERIVRNPAASKE